MYRRTVCSAARSGRRQAREYGQAIVWVAVMLPLFLSIVGLAIDGGIVLSYRRELQNVADSAARAAATQIDQQAYRDSAGSSVVLDVASARQVAAEYLTSQGMELTGTIVADPDRVVVRVEREVPTSFLRLAGITTVRIPATAPAAARVGVVGPGQ